MPLDTVASVCPHDCPSACALEVERIDRSTIGRIRGAAANDYTAGVICAKVARYAERVHHPERLMKPLLRTGPKGSTQFREISWEEALDRVAGAFAEATAKHGAETVWPYYFAGTMGLVNRDGINRLRNVMGYSRQDANICTTVVRAGWIAGMGDVKGTDPREMAQSDLIIMWGGNPVSTQVNVMTHVARARKERGAHFVVVDPYRTPSAEAADEHVMVRPGTDGAVAAAMMHVLFRDGYADRDYMARFAENVAELEDHLKSRTPQWAEAISGVPAAQIEALAKRYGETQRAYIRVGYGFARSRNGPMQVHAVACLPTVGGKWQYEGGGALWKVDGYYKVDKSLIEATDRLDPATRVLDMSRIGPVLTGEDAVVRRGPPVTAMLIQNTNPAAVAPDSGRVLKGFNREDLFVAVHEQFLTETARHADVVLPATTFLEHADLYTAGGHPHLEVHDAVIDAPGDCRSNHRLLNDLILKLGGDHPSCHMTEAELLDATLKKSGYPGFAEMVERRWLDVGPKEEADRRFANGFPTPSGKFRFRADWSALGPSGAGLEGLPDHVDIVDRATEEKPFRMVTAPARNYLNTSFTETATSKKREGRPTVMLHPDAAAELGVEDGGRVRLGNEQGSVVLHARLFDGVQKGTVIVESVWPNAAFEEGVGINLLTSADSPPPMGGAVFHDTAVWVRGA
ncbi:molybdopterin oxidoreductase family protein [Thalassobaculum sp. OXR-137]|uniref:molybdopterin oxidoreductase family protein n=1 Tax=Thalassobaculum sp. OXR-137 TaxID=3100173 RepID=UPI002AC8E644|nr:molybdopterin oxidoreductase family protein [Thalassobaculum sp. OXR-137]WPZ36648.1 molybdopterin oxidoreductase family protein [Thalassobaculum sp. OXR-137]